MTFADYMELKERATKAGVENSPSLKQLLHLIQATGIAKSHFEAYMYEMNEWEKELAKVIEEEIRQAGEQNG